MDAYNPTNVEKGQRPSELENANTGTGAEIQTLPSREPFPDSDKRLLELGYKPEFRREMSLFGVLGISFCAIGILTGMSSAFQTGLFSGGPLGMRWNAGFY